MVRITPTTYPSKFKSIPLFPTIAFCYGTFMSSFSHQGCESRLLFFLWFCCCCCCFAQARTPEFACVIAWLALTINYEKNIYIYGCVWMRQINRALRRAGKSARWENHIPFSSSQFVPKTVFFLVFLLPKNFLPSLNHL